MRVAVHRPDCCVALTIYDPKMSGNVTNTIVIVDLRKEEEEEEEEEEHNK